MIFAIAGRKESGKSTLSKVLIDLGFKKISFADKLKKLVADLYEFPLEDCYETLAKEKKDKHFVWDEEAAQRLCSIAKIKGDLFQEKQIFNSIRDSLQYIGTEVLRRFDNNFHINSILELIDNKLNYVIDDVRFPNELIMLKSLNATSLYVIRPYNTNYSNHSSETTLSRKDFDLKIINDGSKNKFKRKFKTFIGDLKRPMPIKIDYVQDNDVFSNINKESAFWAGFLWRNMRYIVNNEKMIVQSGDKNNLEKLLKFIGSKQIVKEDSIAISSPYIIEDLKLWNIDVDSVKYCPDIVKNNVELLDAWKQGSIL